MQTEKDKEIDKPSETRIVHSVTVGDVSCVGRLDRALSVMVPNLSRVWIGKLIKNGGVMLNGITATKGARRVKIGDIIAVLSSVYTQITEQQQSLAAVNEFGQRGRVSAVVPQPELPLDVVYEDEDLLIVDKPSGMVIHPAYANRSGTLANAIAGYFMKNGIPLIRRIGLVHRLDKDVSGLVIVAKHDRSLAALSEQFSGAGIEPGVLDLRKKARKYYWAVVGPVSRDVLEESGVHKGAVRSIQGFLWRSTIDRKWVEFKEGPRSEEMPRNARYALSYIRYLRQIERNYHLLEVQIVTGRMHQIRVQLKTLGFPIVGDRVYGGVAMEGLTGIRLRCVRIAYIPPRVYLGLLNDNENRESGRTGREREMPRVVISRERVP